MRVVCEICGGEIEEHTNTCPMCGHKNMLKGARAKVVAASIVGTSVIVIMCIGLIFKTIISS